MIIEGVLNTLPGSKVYSEAKGFIPEITLSEPFSSTSKRNL